MNKCKNKLIPITLSRIICKINNIYANNIEPFIIINNNFHCDLFVEFLNSNLEFKIINQFSSRLIILKEYNYVYENYFNAISEFDINPANRNYFSFQNYQINNRLKWNINYVNAFFISSTNFSDFDTDILTRKEENKINFNSINNFNLMTIDTSSEYSIIENKVGR